MYKVIILTKKYVYTYQFNSIQQADEFYEKNAWLVAERKRLSAMLLFFPTEKNTVILLKQCWV